MPPVTLSIPATPTPALEKAWPKTPSQQVLRPTSPVALEAVPRIASPAVVEAYTAYSPPVALTPMPPDSLVPPFATIAVPVVLAAVAVIDPELKAPLASRFTMALAVSALVGATFQASPSVPLVVIGDPLTVKSELGALSPTLVTVPAPGKVWPAAKVNNPLLLNFSPVSAGDAGSVPYNRFKVAAGFAVLLPTGSACH